jgi:hypothetical protein
MDTDGSGWLEYDELREALSLLGMPGWSLNESRRIIAKMDSNSDGNVDFDEFYQHAMGNKGLRAGLAGCIKKMVNNIAETADSDDEDASDYHLGDRVRVDYQGKGVYYEGTIVAKRFDEDTGEWDYDIILDVGGKDFYVDQDKIERLDTTLRRQRRIKRLMIKAADHEDLMASLGMWWRAALTRFDTDNDKHLEKEEFEQFTSHVRLVLGDIGMQCDALDDAWLRHAGTDGKIDRTEFLAAVLEIVTEHTSRHDFDEITSESTRLFHLVFKGYFNTSKLLHKLSGMGHAARKNLLRKKLIKGEHETKSACLAKQQNKMRAAEVSSMQKSMAAAATAGRWGLAGEGSGSGVNDGWGGGIGKAFAKGDLVEARGDDGEYQQGVITGIDASGIFEVHLENGEVSHTSVDHMRRVAQLDMDGWGATGDGWGATGGTGGARNGNSASSSADRAHGVVWYGSTGGCNRGLFTNMQPDSLITRPLDLNPTSHDKGVALGTGKGLCRSFHVRAVPGCPVACEGTNETTDMFRQQRMDVEKTMMNRGQWLLGGNKAREPRKRSSQGRFESVASSGGGEIDGQPVAYSELIWGMQSNDHRNQRMQQWQRRRQQNHHSQTHLDIVALREDPSAWSPGLAAESTRTAMRAGGMDQASGSVNVSHKKLTSTFSSPKRMRPKKPFVLQASASTAGAVGLPGIGAGSPGRRRGARPYSQ